MVDVPVNDQVPAVVVDVVTNGQITFAFDFRADDVGDLRAEYRPAVGLAVPLTGGVDFTATGMGSASGGTITFTSFTATVAGSKVAIYRDIEIERQTDYTRDLFAVDLNAEQDKIFMILQQLRRDVARAVKTAIGGDPDLLVSSIFAAAIEVEADRAAAQQFAAIAQSVSLNAKPQAFKDRVFKAASATNWFSFPSEWGVEARNPAAGSVARKTSPARDFGAAYPVATDRRAYGSDLYINCAPRERFGILGQLGSTGTVDDNSVGFFAEFKKADGSTAIVDAFVSRMFAPWRDYELPFQAPADAVGVRFGVVRKGNSGSGTVFFTDLRGETKLDPKLIRGGVAGGGDAGLSLGATSFSIFAKVLPIGPGADRQLQDFTFNERTRILYLLHPFEVGGIDQAVVSRCRMDGGKDLVSFDVMNTLTVGSGRGLSIQYNENFTDRLWTSASPDKPGKAIRFRYAAGGDATSVTEFQLIPTEIANTSSIYPTVSYDQKWLIALYRSDAGRYFARVWDFRPLAISSGGDFSNDYLFEWPIDQLQLDGGLSLQGMCSDGVHVYIHTGSGDPLTAKKIYKYTLAEGKLVEAIEASTIAQAQFDANGSVREPQGLNMYRRGPGSALQLACTYGTGAGATKARHIFILGEEMPTVYRGDGTLPAEMFMNSRAMGSPVGTPIKIGSWDGGTFIDRLEINDVGIKAKALEGTSYTIADDAAISITVPGPNNTAIAMLNSNLATSTANPQGIIWVNADASPQTNNIALRSLTGIVFTAGILTGTTGVDGNFTISAHTDGKLYLENRTGAARTLTLLFLDQC